MPSASDKEVTLFVLSVTGSSSDSSAYVTRGGWAGQMPFLPFEMGQLRPADFGMQPRPTGRPSRLIWYGSAERDI